MKTEMETDSSPIAELCGQTGWFCIRTQLKHEHIAAAHLQRVPGVDVFNPQLRLLRSTRQGRRWCIESLFPNYIFARFILEAMGEKVAYMPGVKAVVRFGDRTPEIPERVIEDLRRELTGLSSKVLTDAPGEGEQVEIAGGAFAGMTASVTRVLPGGKRAQILLEVMGQLVSAELSLELVLLNRRDAAQLALPRAGPVRLFRPEKAASPAQA